MKAALYFMAFMICLPVNLFAEDKVKVNIKWEYQSVAGVIELYEVKNQPRLWETNSVKSLSSAPIGEKFENSFFELKPGQRKRFALVMKNETDKPISFFASPHVVNPVEHSLGFKFKCLCINHAFNVASNETWYRIVEFRLDKGFIGNELTLTHSIIGIDPKRAESFSKEPVMPDM